MRRKPGALVRLEIAICLAAADLAAAGTREFHGYDLAKQLARSGEREGLATHGTLYRALARLVEMGMVTDRWEDPQLAAKAHRPLRRLYTLTVTGRRAASWHRASTRPGAASSTGSPATGSPRPRRSSPAKRAPRAPRS